MYSLIQSPAKKQSRNLNTCQGKYFHVVAAVVAAGQRQQARSNILRKWQANVSVSVPLSVCSAVLCCCCALCCICNANAFVLFVDVAATTTTMRLMLLLLLLLLMLLQLGLLFLYCGCHIVRLCSSIYIHMEQKSCIWDFFVVYISNKNCTLFYASMHFTRRRFNAAVSGVSVRKLYNNL